LLTGARSWRRTGVHYFAGTDAISRPALSTRRLAPLRHHDAALVTAKRRGLADLNGKEIFGSVDRKPDHKANKKKAQNQ
jgi:hypothetical protein